MNDNDILHAGVKGMKWGVRRERRAERTNLASQPDAPRSLIVRQVLADNPASQIAYAIKNRSFKDGRKEHAEVSRNRNELVKSGEATFKDYLKYYGSTRAEDLIPVRTKNENKTVKELGMNKTASAINGYSIASAIVQTGVKITSGGVF